MGQTQRVGKVGTRIVKDGQGMVVYYHNTPVVTFDNNMIILNTGGWFTATTKVRMNQASNEYGLGYYVKQVGGKWYCDFNGKCYTFEGDILNLKRGQ